MIIIPKLILLFIHTHNDNIKSMRKLIVLTFILLYSLQSKAQYFEAGLTAGVTSYMGDLQPDKPDTRSFSKSGGAFVRWNYSPTIAVKASALYGSFTASD